MLTKSRNGLLAIELFVSDTDKVTLVEVEATRALFRPACVAFNITLANEPDSDMWAASSRRYNVKVTMDIEYTIEEQRVIVGLTPLETAEFERVDAQIPLNAKPVWPDTANNPIEDRWLELYTKHEVARLAPHRRFGGPRPKALA